MELDSYKYVQPLLVALYDNQGVESHTIAIVGYMEQKAILGTIERFAINSSADTIAVSAGDD